MLFILKNNTKLFWLVEKEIFQYKKSIQNVMMKAKKAGNEKIKVVQSLSQADLSLYLVKAIFIHHLGDVKV